LKSLPNAMRRNVKNAITTISAGALNNSGGHIHGLSQF